MYGFAVNVLALIASVNALFRIANSRLIFAFDAPGVFGSIFMLHWCLPLSDEGPRGGGLLWGHCVSFSSSSSRPTARSAAFS
jgi:hypothetical protein